MVARRKLSDSPNPPGAAPERSPADRRRSTAVAGHAGDDERARSALGDSDGRVRATALRALARLERATLDDIESMARDADPVARVAAAEVVASAPLVGVLRRDGKSGDDTGASERMRVCLRTLLSDSDHDVIEAAAFAAGELGPAASDLVPALSALMTIDDSIVRETAVAALGAIGDESALPTILAATSDRATVRRRAVIALAPFEGPAVDAALTAAARDRDWQVRQAAEDQLS